MSHEAGIPGRTIVGNGLVENMQLDTLNEMPQVGEFAIASIAASIRMAEDDGNIHSFEDSEPNPDDDEVTNESQEDDWIDELLDEVG